jgi:hypothetical protein
MLEDDELRELAASIKENGLLNPIVIGEYGEEEVIIDGRNRFAACKIAKVKPEYTELNGIDPLAYIVSANANRRHMTKGQRAMAVAKMYPGGSGKGKNPTELGFHAEYLRQARTVLRDAPDLADAVLIDGTKSLVEAYSEAVSRREQAGSEGRRLEDLRGDFPDLADAVEEGRLTLAGAAAEANERRKRAEQDRATIFKLGMNLQDALSAFSSTEKLQQLKDFAIEFPSEWGSVGGRDVTKLIARLTESGSNAKKVK